MSLDLKPIVVLLAASLLVATNALASVFEQSHAIVIGVDHYPDEKWPSLSYATKDARGMTEFLRGQGFDVTELLDEDATRANIIDVINERVVPNLGDRDRILLFFSGHGETREIGGRDFGYIIPYDGGKSVSSWISMAEMRELSRQLSKAQHQLFIFDSCYGGQFAVPSKGPLSSVPESHPRYIEKITAIPARQFITAGGKGELVRANGPKGYSYFTGYLLEALEGAADTNGDSYTTLSELHGYLEPRASNWDHTPIAGTMPEHGQGNFWFRAPVASNPSEPLDASRSAALSASSEMKGLHREQVGKPSASKLLLTEIIGVGNPTAKKLMEKDLDTVEKIADLSDEDILKYAAVIDGIGPINLRKFRHRAQELLSRSDTPSR